MPRKFNPPPNWPAAPEGWTPPRGWKPDPSWPPPPPGWELWTGADYWWARLGTKAWLAISVPVMTVIIAAIAAGGDNTARTSSAASLSANRPPAAPATATPAPTSKPSPARATKPPAANLVSPSPHGTLVMSFGVAEPDHHLTPGEAFANASTARICVSGFSSSVRDVGTATRDAVFARYGLSSVQPTGAYEVDHLIPLELGGDNSIQNLWPEPNGGSLPGFPSKDRLENKLHDLVCAGQLDIAAAQRAIASDWYAAFEKYVNAPTTTAPAPPPVQTQAAPPPSYPSGGDTYTNVDGNPVPGPVSASAAPAGATAQCADGTYSFSQHHQGTCSHHGGVARWL